MNVEPEAQNMCLIGGRCVSIDSIHVDESLSAAGIVYDHLPERAFQTIKATPTTTMPGWGEMPTFVIPPVSVRRGALVVPRWRVWALLTSESLETPPGPFGGGSQLVLVFYCNDIASSPITELVGQQLGSLDEAIWRQHAQDWLP